MILLLNKIKTFIIHLNTPSMYQDSTTLGEHHRVFTPVAYSHKHYGFRPVK